MASPTRRISGSVAFARSFSATALLCACLLACPNLAFADIAGDINAWLCGILRDTCN